MAFRSSPSQCLLLATASTAVLGLAAAQPTAALAQPAATTSTEVGELVVTGSRFGPRVVTDSATPIDTISSQDLARTGASNLQGQIKVTVPSFSTPRPVGAGANDFLEAPTLRGLSPGQVLVLVDGKRRHTNAELSNGSQIGRGDVSYDFNAIPEAAASPIPSNAAER
jgi:iron complex outermembrane receptor protein